MVYFNYIFIKTFSIHKKKSKITNHKTLNKRTIEAILNKIFTTDANENEQVIEKFKEEYDPKFNFV